MLFFVLNFILNYNLCCSFFRWNNVFVMLSLFAKCLSSEVAVLLCYNSVCGSSVRVPKDVSHFKREREKFIERILQVTNMFISLDVYLTLCVRIYTEILKRSRWVTDVYICGSDVTDCLQCGYLHCVSEKTHQLWNGIAQNYKDTMIPCYQLAINSIVLSLLLWLGVWSNAAGGSSGPDVERDEFGSVHWLRCRSFATPASSGVVGFHDKDC